MLKNCKCNASASLSLSHSLSRCLSCGWATELGYMCHAAGAIKHALGLCRTGPGSTWLRAAEIVVQLKSHFGPRTNVFRMPQQRRSDADVDAGSDWAHFAFAFGACTVCVRVWVGSDAVCAKCYGHNAQTRQ